jgi:hypothetical protein
MSSPNPFPKKISAPLCIAFPSPALEKQWQGNDADGEGTIFFGQSRQNVSGPAACPTSHPGREDNQMRGADGRP